LSNADAYAAGYCIRRAHAAAASAANFIKSSPENLARLLY
jgi:hypothetical protein